MKGRVKGAAVRSAKLSNRARKYGKQASDFTCEICILAGGLSHRMGRDKAKLRLGNRTMVSQIRSMARRTGLPVRVIRRDLVPRCGPLGGIYTGLLTTEKQGVIFLACDMPFVGVDLLHKLIEIGGGRYSVFTKAEASVGFPVLIVRRDFAMIIKQLGERQFSIQSLARRLKGRTLRGNPSLKHQLINVNTLVDWQSAKQLWTSR